MTDQPTKPKGQLLFRIALVGMVLLAILAGIGLAHRSPPEPTKIGAAPGVYADHVLALDAGLAKARAEFEAVVREGLKANDPDRIERGVEVFETAIEEVVYDVPGPVAPTDCGAGSPADPAQMLVHAEQAVLREGKAAEGMLGRYEAADETGADEAAFLAIVANTRTMDAERAKARSLIGQARRVLAECRQDAPATTAG